MTKIAIFVSGSGTNCENIICHFAGRDDISVALVVSNRADAYALVRAKNLNVPAVVRTKAQWADADAMLALLREHDINFIVLAGFLLMVPDYMIAAYERRIINIHPALLPRHGGKGMYGMHVHQAVKESGDTESGLTVHWVSSVCDGGEIIAQFRFPVTPDDTPETIAAKEHVLEMEHFPKVIEGILAGS